jgi:hypothetical protein
MAISNGYATLQDVKASLRVSDTYDDNLIELAIESASRAIDQYTGRNFYNAGTATRLFVAESWDVVNIDDAISISQVQTNLNNEWGTTWASTDYQTEPLNGISDGIPGWPITRLRAINNYAFPIYRGEALVRVTGVWGWSAIPTAIKQATVLQSARFFKRNDSPTGFITSPDLGFIRIGTKLDPDVAMMIDAYRSMRYYS